MISIQSNVFYCIKKCSAEPTRNSYDERSHIKVPPVIMGLLESLISKAHTGSKDKK
jgi:hypothetical protein